MPKRNRYNVDVRRTHHFHLPHLQAQPILLSFLGKSIGIDATNIIPNYWNWNKCARPLRDDVLAAKCAAVYWEKKIHFGIEFHGYYFFTPCSVPCFVVKLFAENRFLFFAISITTESWSRSMDNGFKSEKAQSKYRGTHHPATSGSMH